MSDLHNDDKLMVFSGSEDGLSEIETEKAIPWRVLIADDELGLHSITEMIFQDFQFLGRPIQFLNAYSGKEAAELMRLYPDVALVLMDVVMENEHAGLDAVKYIRQDLNNKFVRIVLRTGQAGQDQEAAIVAEYDINDYKEKTDMTSNKMFTLMYTSLNLYRQLIALEHSRFSLEQIVSASGPIFELQTLAHFSREVLDQLSAVFCGKNKALADSFSGVTTVRDKTGALSILGGIGKFTDVAGKELGSVLDGDAFQFVENSSKTHAPVVTDHQFCMSFITKEGSEHLVYLSSDKRFEPTDTTIIEFFCKNMAIAIENIHLYEKAGVVSS